MSSSGMLHSVDLVRTDVSKGSSISIIRLTRIGEIGKTLATDARGENLKFTLFKGNVCAMFEIRKHTASVDCFLLQRR
jgi:hypothetical protein